MKREIFKVISVLLTAALLMSVFVTPVAVGQDNVASAQINVSQAADRVDVPIDDLLSFADDFIERRTSAWVGTEKMASELVLDNGVAHESMRMFAAEQATMAELNVQRDVLRKWGEAYTHSATELTLQRADIKGDVATLDIKELTKLYYAKIRGDEPDYTAWVARRRFVFANGTAGWELVSQELLNCDGSVSINNGNNGPLPINEPTGVTEDAMRRALAEIASVHASVQFNEYDIKARDLNLDGRGSTGSTHDVRIQSTFSHSAARDYAKRYWLHPNPAYRYFSGRNCTNFISQAMRAGGWTDVPGWYRNPRHWWYNWLNQTWSWVGVRYWHEFALTHSRRTALLSLPRSLWEGEVLLVDFTNDGTKDHTMIVTRKTPSEIYLTYHSRSIFERSFASLSREFPNARWFPHLVFSRF